MIGDGVRTRAGGDDVCAAVAVDRVGACARQEGIGSGRAFDRDALAREQDRRVDVREVGDRDVVANRLVGTSRHAEVDRGNAARPFEDERVGARSAVERGFGSVIRNRVVAATGEDRVSAATAVDGICARSGDNRVRSRRTDNVDRRSQDRPVDVLEIRDCDSVARGLVGSCGDRKIDRRDASAGSQNQGVARRATIDRGLSAMIGHCVSAASGSNRICSAVSINRVGARTTDDRVGARRALQRDALDGAEA